MPKDKPSDIYRVVAEKTIAKLEKIACQNQDSIENGTPEEDEVTEQQLAQWWLVSGMSTKGHQASLQGE